MLRAASPLYRCFAQRGHRGCHPYRPTRPLTPEPRGLIVRGMVVARTILAVLIAMSVVMLPATGEPIVSPSPVEVTMADQADMSCCPCCDARDNFKLTACALKCLTLAGAVLPAMTVTPRYLADGTPLSFASDTLHGLVRQPPTRPPPL